MIGFKAYLMNNVIHLCILGVKDANCKTLIINSQQGIKRDSFLQLGHKY